MGKAIGEILPYAVTAAITVSAIIGIILMLVTPKAKTNGTAFAAGYVLGFALVGTLVILLAGGKVTGRAAVRRRRPASSSWCSECCC